MQRRIAINPSMKRCCTAALAALAWIGPLAAQTVPKPPAAKAAEPKGPAADESFAAGTQAFEQGKTDQAIAALSTAINTGKLAPPQLAKALFYRGVAYRKQAKPGQALSDLTAAVWLRGGLSDTDRVIAEDHRRSLQREVGLPVSPASGPTVAAAAPPAMPAPPASTPAPLAAAPVPPVAAPATVATSAPWTVETAPVGGPVNAPAIAAPIAPPVAIQAPAPAVVANPPAAEPSSAPLPWSTVAAEPAAPPATTPPDAVPTSAVPTNAVPTNAVTVAPVERAALAPLDAAPAPPPKPLPWQTASTPAVPPTPQPLPWATTPAPSPASPDPIPVAAVAREATEPVAPPAVISWPSAAVISAAPPPAAVVPSPLPAAAVPSPPPAEATVSPATMLSDAGKAASSLFGGLLAGVTAPAPAPAPETALAPSRIETAALPETSPPQPAAAPQTSWTAPADPSAPAPALVAPAAPVLALAPVAAPPGKVATDAAPAAPAETPRQGNFKLQVAAAQTRAEAEDALQRLVTKHATTLRGVDPQIEDPPSGSASIFGSMGPAYRVSVGPYMTAVEPGRLCNILRPHGFDCKVVTIETPTAN
jgi:hypothetical protein